MGNFISPELGIYNDKNWDLSHKVYAAMVTRVDNEIGKLTALLRELNIEDNTLIMLASDNGNAKGNAKLNEVSTQEFFENQSPRRGQKGDIFDGAFHVPAIAWWPGKIKPGQVSDHIWAMWDFLPTAAEIARCRQLRKTLMVFRYYRHCWVKKEKQIDHEFLYWEYQQEQAVRDK